MAMTANEAINHATNVATIGIKTIMFLKLPVRIPRVPHRTAAITEPEQLTQRKSKRPIEGFVFIALFWLIVSKVKPNVYRFASAISVPALSPAILAPPVSSTKLDHELSDATIDQVHRSAFRRKDETTEASQQR
jgi:hypothetical protein